MFLSMLLRLHILLLSKTNNRFHLTNARIRNSRVRPIALLQIRHHLSNTISQVTSKHKNRSLISTHIMFIQQIIRLHINRLHTISTRAMHNNQVRTRHRITIRAIRSSTNRLTMMVKQVSLNLHSKNSSRRPLPLITNKRIRLIRLKSTLISSNLRSLLHKTRSLSIMLTKFRPSLRITTNFHKRCSLTFNISSLLRFKFISLTRHHNLLSSIKRPLPHISIRRTLHLTLVKRSHHRKQHKRILTRLVNTQMRHRAQ